MSREREHTQINYIEKAWKDSEQENHSRVKFLQLLGTWPLPSYLDSLQRIAVFGSQIYIYLEFSSKIALNYEKIPPRCRDMATNFSGLDQIRVLTNLWVRGLVTKVIQAICE